MTARVRRYPLGAAVTLAELDDDPHPALARLRDAEPVSWVPVLDGWLVTRRDLALQVMRDSRPSPLTTRASRRPGSWGRACCRWTARSTTGTAARSPRPFSRAAVHDQLEAFVTGEADRLVSAMRPGPPGGGI